MKVLMILAAFIISVVLLSSASNVTRDVSAQGKKPPEVIVLGKEAKLGQITFNHLKHITENRSPDGTKQIACVDCHHTAQPAAEALKHPPHKTAWPADRTTTLTADLLEKDSAAIVNACTDCHARTDAKPRLLPEIPRASARGHASGRYWSPEGA